MSTSPMDVTPQQTVAQAQEEIDRLHRSGAMTLIALAAFWGIAAALYQWGTPLAGQIALLIGSVAAHPVAWLILKLAGGPAMAPRSNALTPLFYQVAGIPVVVTLGAMALAVDRPDAFFAASMLGLAAACLPTATLYGRKLYLILAIVFVALPLVGWTVAQPLLPWFGVIGVALLVVAGALMLRRLGGLAAAPREDHSLPDAAGAATAGGVATGAASSATSTATADPDASSFGVGAAAEGTDPLAAASEPTLHPRPTSDAPWDQAADQTADQAVPAHPTSTPASGMDPADLDDAVITDRDATERPEA